MLKAWAMRRQNPKGSGECSGPEEDGKVTSCMETIEFINEENKTITFKLFNGEIDKHFKVFKVISQAIEKNDGGATVKLTIEYEKINEDVEAPYGYIVCVDKCFKDLDAHLVEAKTN